MSLSNLSILSNRMRKHGGVLAVLVAAGIFVAGCSSDEPGPKQENVAQSPPQAQASIPDGEPVARVASQVEPSVVQVNIEAIQTTPFGGQQEARGLGSGVIYRKDGYIITNNHVVADASQVNVAFADGTTERGEVVGSDPRTEIGVVKVDRNNLPAASFDTTTPTVGQLAVAIGSPSGFESTVTAGVVSGLNRELSPEVVGGGQQDPALVDLIQTDAAISPGNSGGALVNRDGEIIGINVAYLPQTQSGAPVEGIGFAIPSSTAVSVADQLIDTGQVTEPYMGIAPVDISPQDAEQFGLSGIDNGGAGVAQVESGSPADDAGLRAEDVITAVDGKPIESSGDLFGALRDYQPGDTIKVTAVRDGDEQTFEVTLGELPDNG